MPDLDQEALRKPGAAGVPILLADGQEWLVRRPRTLFRSDVTKPDGWRVVFDLGPEYDAAWDRFSEASKGGKSGEVIGAKFAIFRALLVANYELDSAALDSLLVMDFGQPDEGVEPDAAQRLYADLDDIIYGRTEAEKPTAAGST